LEEFADGYGRCDTRRYLPIYVDGQMSDLQRKSAEAIALRAKIPPRSLQAFLGLLDWDEDRLVDRLQWIVVRDHAHPWAIGIVDETSCPKDGSHTACTQRQWCGSLGKKENCVVSVHVGYTVGDFHCVLDSDLFVPESWANHPAKRAEVGMPDEIVHRTKAQIALEQIRRALGNGIRVAAWTFDEHYGQGYDFLDGLEGLGQTYVAEVPSTFHGWVQEPATVYRATGRGLHRHGPRLARTAPAVSEVRDLLGHSPAFRQPWTPIHLQNGADGPIVREVQAVPFFMRRHGLPTRAHWLIAARDPQKPKDIKFFVSNAAPGVPLEWLVHVAYSRWPIEPCFREEKDELGFDHFEVRGWQSIHRHLYLSQVSHLFLNQTRAQLVAQESGEKPPPPSGLFFPPHRKGSPTGPAAGELDGRAGSLRGFPVAPSPAAGPPCRTHPSGRRRRHDQLPAPAQHRGTTRSHQNQTAGTTPAGN